MSTGLGNAAAAGAPADNKLDFCRDQLQQVSNPTSRQLLEQLANFDVDHEVTENDLVGLGRALVVAAPPGRGELTAA